MTTETTLMNCTFDDRLLHSSISYSAHLTQSKETFCSESANGSVFGHECGALCLFMASKKSLENDSGMTDKSQSWIVNGSFFLASAVNICFSCVFAVNIFSLQLIGAKNKQINPN